MALITNVSSKKTQFYSCKIHQFSSMFKVAFSLVLFSRKLGSKLTFRNWRDFLEPSCVSWLQSAEAAAADYASILVDAKASAFVVFRHLFTYLYRHKLLVMMLFSNFLHFLRNKDFFSISTFLFDRDVADLSRSYKWLMLMGLYLHFALVSVYCHQNVIVLYLVKLLATICKISTIITLLHFSFVWMQPKSTIVIHSIIEHMKPMGIIASETFV